MPASSNELLKILKSEIFLNLMKADKIKITELNAAISLLIKCNIGFDVVFTPGTTRDFPEAILTVYINPNTDIDFTFQFDKC